MNGWTSIYFQNLYHHIYNGCRLFCKHLTKLFQQVQTRTCSFKLASHRQPVTEFKWKKMREMGLGPFVWGRSLPKYKRQRKWEEGKLVVTCWVEQQPSPNCSRLSSVSLFPLSRKLHIFTLIFILCFKNLVWVWFGPELVLSFYCCLWCGSCRPPPWTLKMSCWHLCWGMMQVHP